MARKLILMYAAVLAIGLCRTVFAASTLDVLPAGEGVFVIQGTGIENAGAMDLIITYDISTLSNPRVAQGALISGAMMVVNDKSPGSVRLGIIRVTPIQGTGIIATLTFDRRGYSAGKIISLAVNKFTNVNGQALPIVARITNPANAPAESSGPVQKPGGSQAAGAAGAVSSASTSPAAGGLPTMLPGGILPPAGVSPEERKDQSTAVSPSENVPAAESTAAAMEPGAASAGPKGITASLEPGKKKVQQYESVLDRFRKHGKDRTKKAFLSFFDQDEASGFRQDPPVALTDGKAPVKIFFIVPQSDAAAPDFALRGARLVSVQRDADRTNTWVIEALPEKGEYQASLLVSEGDIMREYPLTLAPKIKLGGKSGTVKDEDFGRYLNGKRRDLNGDGKRDYLDDYIFTANFIAARRK